MERLPRPVQPAGDAAIAWNRVESAAFTLGFKEALSLQGVRCATIRTLATVALWIVEDPARAAGAAGFHS